MIGAVTFHPEREYIGGAQVPTFAFMEWTNELCIESEIVDYNDVHRMNSCDWIFFGTPGRMNSITGKFEFPIDKIEVPFAVMIHAEFDVDLYNQFVDFISHPMCRLIVVIGEGYWETKVPQLYWHPCTLPDYLIKETTEFENSNRYGLIYAARISTWKGINKLAALSLYEDFLTKVDHRIDVYGKRNRGDFVVEEGNFNLFEMDFNIYKVGEIGERNSRYKYFWDVCGTPSYKMPIKRLNLAAVEAMRFGCIPIGNPVTIYPYAREFCVDLGRGFPKDFFSAQEKMKECVLKSPMSYESVKRQVVRIIDHMTGIT